MKTLEERIQLLEDIRACEQLHYTYAAILDSGYNGEELKKLFVPDGLWEIKGVGGRAEGHEGIVRHATNLGKAIKWGQHNMFMPQVEVAEDGKTATGSFRLLCTLTMLDGDKEDAYVLVGKYSNTYVKVDGRWYYKELTGTIDESAPWDKGWVKAPMKKESWD